HRLARGGDAHLPRPVAALGETLPAGDGRQECLPRDGFGRPRRRGGRGDALHLQPAEPEVQRHLACVRAPRRRPAFPRAADRADAGDDDGGSGRARRVLRTVINAGAVQKFERAVAQARREGTILLGGQRLTGGGFDRGHFVAPTIAALPLTSSLFLEELFVPLLAVGEVAGLDEAIAEANKAEYGLTAGIFSKKPEEIERFFDEIE